MAWFVYILRCADNSLYTGSTTDLNRRLLEHQEGRGSSYTRSRRPLTRVWSRRSKNRSTAQKLEARIKALPKSQKAGLVLGNKRATLVLRSPPKSP